MSEHGNDTPDEQQNSLLPPVDPAQVPAPPVPPVPPVMPAQAEQPVAPQVPSYAQQPQAPQYQAPAGYGTPEAPAYAAQQQGWAPGTPSGGEPPKRGGLSTGAWIGIGAAALVLIAGIVLAIVFFVIIPGQSSDEADNETTTKTQTQTQSPDDDDDDDDNGETEAITPSGEVLTMDDTANFDVGPYWSVSFESGWDIDVFDVAGENQLSHPVSGCQFYSYQGFGGVASSTDSDQTASEMTIENAVQSGFGLPWDYTSDPNVAYDDIIEVSAINYAGVEMLRYSAEYTATDGTEHTRVFMIRNFQPSDAVLYAISDCPTSAASTGADMLEALAVNDAF